MRPTGVTHRILVAVLLAASLAACGSTDPSLALVAIPTRSPDPLLDTGLQGCPGALLEGTLVRDEQHGVAVRHDDAALPAVVVVWPHGWVAADIGGARVVLDPGGRAVGREGDRFSAGGGFSSPDDWFHPCGEITFAAAGPGG